MSETPPNPTPNPTPPPAPPPAPPKPETFSREYVEELRSENGHWRQKAHGHAAAEQAAKAAAEQAARDAADKAERDAAEKVAQAEARAQERIIRAELRTAAIKAGMIDLDGLKLLDLSAVKLNDAGDVEGAETLIDAAKKAKPYLFGSPSNTSNPTPPPAPKPPAAKSAKDMTDDEFNAAMRARAWRG